MSAEGAAHAEHAEPPLPQAAAPWGWHTCAASQQPMGQLPALQVPPVHTPPVQVCAAPHAGPAPHRHVPCAEQPSALPIAHAAHAVPGAAQAPTASVVHVLPAQQPDGHDVASHTQAPPTQRWPGPHAEPAPHAQAPAAVQPSATALLQATQAAPGAPHVAADRVEHTPF